MRLVCLVSALGVLGFRSESLVRRVSFFLCFAGRFLRKDPFTLLEEGF